jgi:DEAD/DEAH box helicase domain-containing protein
MDEVIEFIYHRFAENLKAHKTLPEEKGSFSGFPSNLHPELISILKKINIHSLYEHQLKAFESISSGKDTLVISKTASGKTLSFLLPVLDHYLKINKKFSTLLLYPTKALSRDQQSTLHKLLYSLESNSKLGTFDGDTPTEERTRLKDSADFILSNPDMLHSGILPNHNRKWKKFLSRLKYIIIDEVHTYRGAFGSHVANVFTRLIRICRLYGADPIFICSSATVGNPNEHVQALFKRDFEIINKDSSPRPQRELFFLNPTYVQKETEEFRKSTSSISLPLIEFAARNKIRTICFCRARQEVEKLYSAVIDSNPSLMNRVRPYRGGLLPNERRKIEEDLFSGKVSVIISTNALELGIDIGDLELCILSGFPGSFASFWQQAGRVGRKGKRAGIVYIAKDQPIDQYLVNHPEFILQTPIEEAWLSSFNPYILLQHLPCAAYENPIHLTEPLYQNPVYELAIETLVQNKTLSPYREYFRYALQNYPAQGVSLRGMSDSNVIISFEGKIIGEIDPISARATVHKEAIYQHFGIKYLVKDFNLETNIAEVIRKDVDYYTEASWETMVQMLEVDEKKELHTSLLKLGSVNVSKQTKLFKKIKERTKDNIGSGSIHLPPFVYDTIGLCLHVSDIWVKEMNLIDTRYFQAGLFGLSYILKKTSPSLCMGDASDIYTDVAMSEAEENVWKSSLYLYDALEGGVGFAEKIFQKFEEALKLALSVIEECECTAGCPACVTPEPEGITDLHLLDLFFESNASVECTKSMILYLLKGEIYSPQIEVVKNLNHSICQKKSDQEWKEKEKMLKNLNRAASILQKKRDRAY